MSRIQVQLPDDAYERAHIVCESRKISMAELARRGFEYILSVYSQEPTSNQDWQPPKPRRLGWKGLSDAQLKEQDQMTNMESAPLKRRQRA